jgi:hypothetical protein
MILFLLLTCSESVPSEQIDIGPLLDTTLSYVAEAPYGFYSEDFCFRATSTGQFYIYEPGTTWIYSWAEQDINVYDVVDEQLKEFMEIQVLGYADGIYELKLRQGLLSATVHTTKCSW